MTDSTSKKAVLRAIFKRNGKSGQFTATFEDLPVEIQDFLRKKSTFLKVSHLLQLTLKTPIDGH